MSLDTKKTRAKLSARRQKLEARVRFALDEAGRVALDVARSRAPGRAGETLSARATQGFVAGVRISSSWDKIVFVENDTAPHVITPSSGRVLRFVANGSTVFARVVRHPGTRGHHFMAAGRAAGREVLKVLLHAAISGR